MSTQFRVTMRGLVDMDTPITYKYQFYLTEDDYKMDIINGTDRRKKIITDFIQDEQYIVYLPTGVPDLTNITNLDFKTSIVLILVSASDKAGSISNYTFPIKVHSFFSEYTTGT